MAWTRAKTAIVAGLAAILVVGTTRVVVHRWQNASAPRMHISPGPTPEQLAQAQQTARVFFEAVGKGEWAKLNEMCLPGWPVFDRYDETAKARLIGLELVRLGTPYTNAGKCIVPYTIRFKNGQTYQYDLELVRDDPHGKWLFVRGFGGFLRHD